MTSLPVFSPLHALAIFSACTILLAGTPAYAQTPDQFDKPASVRSIKPKPDDSTEIRCTYFSDLMVRETQDGPESENAAIVRNPKAACKAGAFRSRAGETAGQPGERKLEARLQRGYGKQDAHQHEDHGRRRAVDLR